MINQSNVVSVVTTKSGTIDIIATHEKASEALRTAIKAWRDQYRYALKVTGLGDILVSTASRSAKSIMALLREFLSTCFQDLTCKFVVL